MRVLVACEESQVVCKAFRERGHEAYSCDLIETSGEHTEWHIVGDAVQMAMSRDWDLMIAFPPCTYLTCTANRSFLNNPERWKKRLDAVYFVHALMNCKHIPHIAIENPKGVISTHIRKPDQYIQPYEHGHTDSKITGLWLKNLPLIVPTNIVKAEWITSNGDKLKISMTTICKSKTFHKHEDFCYAYRFFADLVKYEFNPEDPEDPQWKLDGKYIITITKVVDEEKATK